MRLTSYRNLSALVTCHTLYVVLTTWQSAVFLVNSRLTHFTATRTTLATLLHSPVLWRLPVKGGLPASQANRLAESPKWCGYPFFRSYGARLPSSLTRFHSRAFSIFYSPTCVGLRYGQPWQRVAFFSVFGSNDPVRREASPSPCGTGTISRQPFSHAHFLPR